MNLSLIEFYTSPQGQIMYTTHNTKETKELSPSDIDFITKLYDKIEKEFPLAHQSLKVLCKKSKLNLPVFRYRVVRQFIACNMGDFDLHRYDIGELGDMQLEEVKCPLRSRCPYEGIICKPKPVKITPREEQILKYLAYGYSTQNVAELLKIAYDTVENHKRKIFKKLNCDKITDAIFYYHNFFKK